MIDRLQLLDWLLPCCDRRYAALLYPKGGEGLSPGWIKRNKDFDRAVESYRNGTLAEQEFESVTNVSGTFESCVVDGFPEGPSVRLTNTTLDFLCGFVQPGARNIELNKAAHELGRRHVSRDEAWRLCKCGAQLCGLNEDEPAQTERTFDSGYCAGSGQSGNRGGNSLPLVLLPGGPVKINESAERLGQLLANTKRYYCRGGAIVTLNQEETRTPELQLVKPAAMASRFEQVATLMRQGDRILPTTCCEQQAKLIMCAEPFVEALPVINLLSPCPVLVDRGGELVEVVGYDHHSGILASGPPTTTLSVEVARGLLFELFGDFKFATPADRSRAVAAVITPALVFGGHLPGRAPVDLGEANESQAGKGFRN